MKIYEIVPKGFNCVQYAVKQGKYFRNWNKEKNVPYDSIWLQTECEVLLPLVEEFYPAWTMVYTSHGKKGVIISRQQRDYNGTLHPAIVQIGDSMNFIQVAIWQDQLIKAIK